MEFCKSRSQQFYSRRQSTSVFLCRALNEQPSYGAFPFPISRRTEADLQTIL